MTGPLDNLNIDINDVDTSIPMLPAGVHPAEIRAATKEENKRRDGFNLVLTFATLQEVPDSTGKRTVPVGHTVRTWIPWQPRSDADKEQTDKFVNRWIRLIDAIFGTTQGNRPKLDENLLPQMVGKKVQIRTTVDNDEMGARENVQSVLPMG